MTTRESPPADGIYTRDPQYTWEDTIAAIGQDFASGEEQVADEVIEYTSVARFCEVWEMGNPIYWYEDTAHQAGYRNVAVPWSAIKQSIDYKEFWRPGDPMHVPPNLDKNATARLASFSPAGRPVPAAPPPRASSPTWRSSSSSRCAWQTGSR